MIKKDNIFGILIVVVGLAGSVLGFRLINAQFKVEGEMSWGMISSIFLWLILITNFIFLGIAVDVIKKHFEEAKTLNDLLRVENLQLKKK